MTTPRAYHKAALLPSGQVLLAGGSDIAFNPLSSADLSTPATGEWTRTEKLKIIEMLWDDLAADEESLPSFSSPWSVRRVARD